MMPKRKVASVRVTSTFQVPPLLPGQSPHATVPDVGSKHETQERPPPPTVVARRSWHEMPAELSAPVSVSLRAPDHELGPQRREGRACSWEPVLAAGGQGTAIGKHNRESPGTTRAARGSAHKTQS